MPQSIDQWRARNVHRAASDSEFGATWTSAVDPDEPWRLAWNSGSCELYAVSGRDGDVETLGTYATRDDVVAALPDWEQRATQPGGLDWVRERVLLDPDVGRFELPQPSAEQPVYGVVLHADGRPPDRLHEHVHAVCSAARSRLCICSKSA